MTARRQPLTSRQQDTLDNIVKHVSDNGWPPTIKELADAMGMYPNAVMVHIDALERKGWIDRARGIARGIKVI